MSMQVSKALAFCAHLAAAVRDGSKTVTYKPLSPGDLARRARGFTSDAVPYPVGAKASIYEPWGYDSSGKIFESSFTPNNALAKRTPPPNFRAESQLGSGLTATITACDLVKLSSLTEMNAQECVVAPPGSTALAEFERQWRDAYRGPQAWEQDPLCWRIEFTVDEE